MENSGKHSQQVPGTAQYLKSSVQMKNLTCDLSTVNYPSYHDTINSQAIGLKNKTVADSQEDTTIYDFAQKKFKKYTSKHESNSKLNFACLVMLPTFGMLEKND